MPLEKEYGWSSKQSPSSCGYIIPAVVKHLRNLSPSTILDLGSGNGALTNSLTSYGYTVVGVEPDSAGLAISKQHCPQADFFNLAVGDRPDLILDKYPEGFDIVVSTEVIEHLYAPRELLEFAYSVLKSNGHLLLTTPYHGYLKNLAISLCNGWDKHFSALWDGGHIKFFSRATMTNLLEGGGFRVSHFSGVGRLPFLWKSMLVLSQKVPD